MHPSESASFHTIWGTFGNPKSVPLLGLWVENSKRPWVAVEDVAARTHPNLDPALSAALRGLGERIGGLPSGDWKSWRDAMPIDRGIEAELKIKPEEEALVQNLSSLEKVCAQPRSHLKTEEHRELVGRVRKLSNRAVPDLAARSEDWQARTFGGVRPARLLAIVTEDDWATYENRVAVTLHRRIFPVLTRRVAFLRGILLQLEAIDELGKTALLGSRFRRERLTKLLGLAFDDPPEVEAVRALSNHIHELLRRIRSIQGSFLVKELQSFRSVPPPLVSTNLFRNDDDYSRIVTLWNHWMQGKDSTPDATARREATRQSVIGHQRYSRVLVTQALSILRLDEEIEADQKGVFNLARGWILKVIEGGALELFRGERLLLRLLPLAISWRDLPEHEALERWQALENLCEGVPTVCLALDDGSAEKRPNWSTGSESLFDRAQGFAFLEGRLGLIEVSPRRLDSGEAVLRFLRMVIFREEWPSLPFSMPLRDFCPTGLVPAGLSSAISFSSNAVIFQGLPLEEDRRIFKAAVDSAKESMAELDGEIRELESQSRGRRPGRQARARIQIQLKEKKTTFRSQSAAAANLQSLSEAFEEVTSTLRNASRCPCCPSDTQAELTAAGNFRCLDCKTEWGRLLHAPGAPAFILPKDVTGGSEKILLDPWGADVITPIVTEPDGTVRPC